MRILITGASGFIGSHMVKRLMKVEHTIHCLESDLTDHAAVTAEVIRISPDVVVHLAARTEVEKSFYEQTTFSDVNYTGTVNLIEAANRVPNLQNFVFASTMEVYGWQPIQNALKRRKETLGSDQLPAFDESIQPNPNAPYAVAKYACEKYLEYMGRCFDFQYTILRQTNSYGRKDNNFFVVEQMIYQMLTQEDVYFGYGTPYRNFLYIDDLIDVWEKVIENPNLCKGQLFCLGPANAVRISVLADMIAERTGFTGNIHWDRKPERPGEIWLLNSTNTKISKTLGWRPMVTLEEGLDRTVESWKHIISEGLPINNETFFETS